MALFTRKERNLTNGTTLNPHGVHTSLPETIDATSANNPGKFITAKMYHGLAIEVGGRVIGRIDSWEKDAYTRGGEHVYELGFWSAGRPVAYAPGISTGYTIRASRVELWKNEVEIAFGLTKNPWTSLEDQNSGFEIRELLYRRVNGASGNSPTSREQGQIQIYSLITYTGCWFRSKNENAFTVGDVPLVRSNIELAYVDRKILIEPPTPT